MKKGKCHQCGTEAEEATDIWFKIDEEEYFFHEGCYKKYLEVKQKLVISSKYREETKIVLPPDCENLDEAHRMIFGKPLGNPMVTEEDDAQAKRMIEASENPEISMKKVAEDARR